MTCALEHLGGCHGRLEWDHVVKQQRIKRQFPHGAWWTEHGWVPADRYRIAEGEFSRTLGDILGDRRNRRWLCTRHHELVHRATLRAPVPESVWEFADEFGLRAMLENDLARQAA